MRAKIVIIESADHLRNYNRQFEINSWGFSVEYSTIEANQKCKFWDSHHPDILVFDFIGCTNSNDAISLALQFKLDTGKSVIFLDKSITRTFFEFANEVPDIVFVKSDELFSYLFRNRINSILSL